jgi:hypothetical protein
MKTVGTAPSLRRFPFSSLDFLGSKDSTVKCLLQTTEETLIVILFLDDPSIDLFHFSQSSSFFGKLKFSC